MVGIRVDFSDKSAPPLIFRAGADIGDITWASGTRASPFGVVGASWLASKEGFEHNITVPVNSRARVMIPAASVEDVKESGQPLSAFPNVIFYVGMATEGSLKLVVVDTLSGEFHFTSPWSK